MTLLVLVGLGGFVVGILTGLALREAWEIARTGHTRTMPALRRLRAMRFGITARQAGVAAVTIVLALNALNGFLLIDQRRRDADDARLDAARTECNRLYNELDGKARDEVAKRAAVQTASTIAWVDALRRGVKTGALTAEQFDAKSLAYLRSLRGTQTARASHPYPPPDFCNHPERFAK